MSRKPYIVIIGPTRFVSMWTKADVRNLHKVSTASVKVYGPYASEAEAQDNLEGEPNPALKVK